MEGGHRIARVSSLARGPMLLALGLWVTACLTPTEVKLSVTALRIACAAPSDIVFDGLVIDAGQKAIDVATGEPEAASSRCESKGDTADLGSLVVIPRDGSANAEVLVAAGLDLTGSTGTARATARECLDAYRAFLNDPKSCDGGACSPCIVARRRVGFVPHQRLSLGIELTLACKGVFCKASETCGSDGRCVSNEAHCDGGTCSLGQGGSGGAGGSSTSVTTSTATGLPPGPAVGTFVNIEPIETFGIDGDPAGMPETVWAAAQDGFHRCVNTACVGTIAPMGVYRHVSMTGGLVAAATDQFVAVTQNSAASFLPTAVTGCGAQGKLFDLHATPNLAKLAYLTNDGSTTWVGSSPSCAGSPLVNAPPIALWSFDGTTGLIDAWVATGIGLSFIPGLGQIAFTDPMVALALWGYPGIMDQRLYALGATSLHVFRGGATIAEVVPLPGASSVIRGFPFGDGSGELWLAGLAPDGTLRMYEAPLDTAGAVGAWTEVALATPLTPGTLHAMWVGPKSVWVASSSGLAHAPRM